MAGGRERGKLMPDSKSLDQVSEALDHFTDALRDLCAGIASDLLPRPEPAGETGTEGD